MFCLFFPQTPYTIMFGPDRCGSDAKLHFIFRHVNPKNRTVEEKHCKKLDTKERSAFEEVFKVRRRGEGKTFRAAYLGKVV